MIQINDWFSEPQSGDAYSQIAFYINTKLLELAVICYIHITTQICITSMTAFKISWKLQSDSCNEFTLIQLIS
jgi:hypothetical protein